MCDQNSTHIINILNHFCNFLVILWDFIEGKKTKFLIQIFADQAVWQSTDRSTEQEVGRPGGRPMCTQRAQPGPVDRTVDRP